MLLLTSLLVAAAGTQPNILLLFPDQWRYDWDGVDPKINTGPLPLHMPTVKRVAEGGVRFTQAYVPAPVCAPSRSCLASGREYDEAGVAGNFINDYPITQETFYTRLRDIGGYHTMITGKDDLTKDTQLGSRVNYSGCSYCTDGDGLYHQQELGFSDGLRYSGKVDVMDTPTPHEMFGFFLTNHTVQLPNGTTISAWDSFRACMKGNGGLCTTPTYPQSLYQDHYTYTSALKLLDRKPAGKPWYLQVNFPGPHPPFSITTKMANSVAGRVWPQATDYHGSNPTECGRVAEPSNEHYRCNYGAELENIDSFFGGILDKVAALGEMDQTVICISSDHGEMLNDHGDNGKTLPWQGSASVPLICMGPGFARNTTVHLPVGTMDLSATFLDLAGVSLGVNMTSKSLRGLLEGGDAETYKPVVSSGLDEWRMVIKNTTSDTGVVGSYKYVCCNGTCPQRPSSAPSPTNGWTQMLIHFEADEFDMHDLAPTNPRLVDELRPLLPPVYAEGCKKAYGN